MRRRKDDEAAVRYPCPCCGFLTYRKKPVGEYDICPVCFREDDPWAYDDPDAVKECNRASLRQAQEKFRAFGACTEDMIPHVRAPLACEMPAANDRREDD